MNARVPMPTLRREAKDIAVKQVAYARFEIKSIDEEKREIEGIASTPEPDRMDDIVEPDGAEYSLPLPFLWQHESWEAAVGQVIAAKPTKDGIPVRIRFARVAEEGKLKERVDYAWQSVKYQLVTGLSIGFRPKEWSEMDGTWGLRFTKWDWMELSAVTIPANADCTITTIKTAAAKLRPPGTIVSKNGEVRRPAPGQTPHLVVKLAPTLPGASGTQSSKPEDHMKTIAQQIADFEAKRAANIAAREAIQNKAVEDGRSKDTAEKEQFDTLTAEISSIDAELVDLRMMEKQAATTATAVTTTTGTDPLLAKNQRGGNANERQPYITTRSNLEPGVRFARYCQALIRGKGNPQMALACIEQDPIWMRSTPELAMVMKNAIAAGDTTTAGWASELVYAENLANEFIEYLRPMTILGKIPNFRRVPFNIRVGGMNSGTTGYWVGQGASIPVSKGGTTSVSLAIAKAAGITAIDNELAKLSTPSAELMIRNDLAKAITYLMDDSFINPNNGGVTNVSPASMTYGVTPTNASGATYAAMRTDLQAMMEAALDAYLDTTGSVWIMSATLALKLSMMVNALDQRVSPNLSVNGGEFQGMPAIVSQAAQIAGSPDYDDVLIWLHPQEVFMADDGQITVEASREASLQLLDNPTGASTGGTTAVSMVSMYQTESMAIKAVRYVNWTKRRSTAAQWIRKAAYTG